MADFNGDGKDDLFLQRSTPGDHYVLLTEDGGIGAISQSLPNDAAGLDWSGKAHRLVAGDFDGDGRADLFLQANDAEGLNAVLTTDAEGLFTATEPLQSWKDGYAGFDWAVSEAHVFAADFNGDGRDDLLLQAEPLPGTGAGTTTPAAFAPNMNGVVLAGKAPFATEGVQAWSRDGFKAEWSPLASVISTADFNGDGRSDVLLQGQSASDASYLLYGRPQGPIFEPTSALEAGSLPAAQDYTLLAGSYGGKSASLYAQAHSPEGTNFLASLTPSAGGTAVVTTLKDATLAFDAGAAGLESAPASGGGAGPLALLLANTPGRTPGQFAVSPMGAATYQIPIWTPPGARGIEPHLALVYTSGSPDGMMGPGWNLAGLSAIARCNKTYADNNGSPGAVLLNTADDFCLDGNRMRVTTSTTTQCTGGASGTVYYTMVANFSRITACGTAGYGPSYFIVEGKDGLIYEYGNTADSKAYANGGSTPYAWMQNKVRDRQGNNLKVVYSTTSGAVQPSYISYTQTPSTNGTIYPFTITFTYQNRVTNLSKYVAGGSISETKVLTKIDVKLLGITSVRQYTFTYATAPTTQRDRLASIQECAGSSGTECLKATTVSYQNGTAGITAPTTLSGSGATVANTLRSADLDGDGRDDLLFAAGSTVWVQFATSSGFGAPINTGAASAAFVDDFQGSGRSCILSPNAGTLWSYCWNSSTGSFTAATTGAPTTYSMCQSADYYGRGKADVVCMGNPTGSPQPTYVPILLYANTSSGSSVTLASTPATIGSIAYNINVYQSYALYGSSSFPNTPVRRMDFNGDGAEDLLLYHYIVDPYNGLTYTYVYSLGIGSMTVLTGTFAQGAFTPVRWNDDACTDIVSSAYVQVSQCNGGISSGFTLPTAPALFVDWDGDGRTDALSKISGACHLSP